MRAVCRRLEGAFTLVATAAAEPDTLVAARRSSPLVVGRRRRRVLPGLRRRRVHRAHPRGARARPGPGRRDRPHPRPDRHRLRRQPGRAQGLHGRLGRRRRREGRLRLVHAQGDRRAAAGGRRHPARPARRRRAGWSSTRCACPTRSCATSTRSSSSPAAPPTTPGLIAKYAIEHWTRIPVEVELASEFRYRDPVLDRSTLVVVDQPVRRDHGHADGAAARQGPEGPRAGDLQRQRLDHPARVRRRALHARRPGDRRRLDQGLPRPSWSPATSSGCSSPRCAA